MRKTFNGNTCKIAITISITMIMALECISKINSTGFTDIGLKSLVKIPSKGKPLTVFILLFFITFIGCSPIMPEVGKSTQPVPGMIKINASGKSFIQGAADSKSSGDEKPVMVASFSYDFWMDSVEVTQRAYADYIGRRPVKDSSAFGAGDNLPVYYVSWFDAILFCNKRSKREHLDTAYSYFGAPLEKNGRVYALAGVQIHYERDAYRLPTESEWEYAAREGSSQIPFPGMADSLDAEEHAWYFSNARGCVHPVATRRKNGFGLYDMAGNVYEWTSDWRGPYSVTSIANSVGALQPNSGNERVVKGGSFEHGFLSLRFSRRSSSYGTPQPTTVEYIGFRCARGPIGRVSYITRDTSSFETHPVNVAVTSIQSLLPTSLAKAVFVNVNGTIRTLCCVDFARSLPVVSEFRDCTTVFAPVISPNGKYVAFSTRNWGFSGPASVYLRSLDSLGSPCIRIPADSAYEPRFWVDPATLDTFIIFTNSAIDNSSPLWASSQTWMIHISGGKPTGVPGLLAACGSFHGGRSVGGQYLVTGYTRLLVRDLSADTNSFLFTYPNNGKEANGSTQVCNVTMSPDSGHNGQCMFLDFGCSSVSRLTGEPYGIHQYLLTARISGEVTSCHKCPIGEASWNHPSWSNIAPLAIGCGVNDADESHAIYLIDLPNKRTLKIMEGHELEEPSFWVNPSAVFSSDKISIDSLGRYNSPSIGYNQPYFTARMLAFWRQYKNMRVVFAGSSQTAYGVDPARFSVLGVFNLAIPGGDFPIETAMIMGYVLNHCDSLKFIGMDLIPGCLFQPGIVFEPEWDNDILSSVGYHYDQNHQFWSTGLPLSFSETMLQIPIPNLPDFDTLGVYRHACQGWGGTTPDHAPHPTWTTDDPTYKVNIALLKNFAEKLARHGVHFLLYLTPVNPAYKKFNVFESSGPDMPVAKQICDQLLSLQDSIPGYFHFYNADNFGNHDFSDADAYDANHLCTVGARKFSSRLDSLVKSILK
jgi:uncharacterized protein (TIGR02171 family)